ncbi:MAG: hypothetical protein IT448_10070 [Phycisphaerales bacterium]|nr:hypothetical protein [Phycisphaerales bacterium]
MNKSLVGLLLGAIALLNGVTRADSSPARVVIDAGATGTPIHREIIGTNWDLPDIQSAALKLPPRTLARGVAGGLFADTFNWQDCTGGSHHPTIDFLRALRDAQCRGMITVNVRGTGTGVGYVDFQYLDTSFDPLLQLASQWVRYVNFIIPNGPQNDEDRAILARIDWSKWSSSPKLPDPGEAPLPRIKYWEIGNEPEIAIQDFEFTDDPEELPPHLPGKPIAEYIHRYKTITAAMKKVDPTIKVGPAMLDSVPENAMPLLNDHEAVIDFWGYHPYDDLGRHYHSNGTPEQIEKMQKFLRDVRTKLIKRHELQRQAFIKAGRDPDQVEFFLTEWNVMSWKYNYPSMYQAMGFAESIFTFAQLSVAGANYWGNLINDQKVTTEPGPAVRAWLKLEECLGDTLLNSHIDDANNLRLYTTRDSQTGQIFIWGLNFNNDSSRDIDLSLDGLNAATATLSTLSSGADTRLWTINARWADQPLPGFDAANFTLHIPSASIVLLKVQPGKSQ